MSERKEVIRDFCELILKEMMESMEKVPLTELSQYHNILLIRSAKNEEFNKLVDKIIEINPMIQFTFFGNGFDRLHLNKVKDVHAGFNYKICVYDGKFDKERMDEYKKELHASNRVDAIVFINYSPHRESYLNVEEIANVLSDKNKIPIYAAMVDGELYKYWDIENHINTIRLYGNIVEWFHV